MSCCWTGETGVPYFRGQAVKFNVMDRDSQGVRSLVVKRGDTTVEEIALDGRGVIERLFNECGDYAAHCVMSDGSESQACEFAVCDLDFSLPAEAPARDKPWDIKFTAHNVSVIAVRLMDPKPPYYRCIVWPTNEDRRSGKVTVPAGSIQRAGKLQGVGDRREQVRQADQAARGCDRRRRQPARQAGHRSSSGILKWHVTRQFRSRAAPGALPSRSELRDVRQLPLLRLFIGHAGQGRRTGAGSCEVYRPPPR